MNEMKTTVEQLMDDCFKLKDRFGSCSYLHLTKRASNDKGYEANCYGMDIIYATSLTEALTRLKSALEDRAKKEVGSELYRAEIALQAAQTKVSELTAFKEQLATNQ